MSDITSPDTIPAKVVKRRGPATIFGKSRSALNATRHGLYARKIVLPAETYKEFQALLDSYIEQYRPQTVHEHEIVSVMAATR